MRDLAPGRSPARVVGAIRRAMWGGLLAIVGCTATWAAEDRPDMLGLRRLEAALQTEAEIESEDPLVTEEPFILPRPEDEAATTDR